MPNSLLGKFHPQRYPGYRVTIRVTAITFGITAASLSSTQPPSHIVLACATSLAHGSFYSAFVSCESAERFRLNELLTVDSDQARQGGENSYQGPS